MDSIGLTELRRMFRTLAQAAAEGRDNPLKAAGDYAQGLAGYIAEGLDNPAARAMIPGANFVGPALRGFSKARPGAPTEPDVVEMREDPAMREAADIVGLPSPGGGSNTAMRKIFTKIYDKNKLQQFETEFAKAKAERVKLEKADWSPLRDYRTSNQLGISPYHIENILEDRPAAERLRRLTRTTDIDELLAEYERKKRFME